MGEWPDLGGRLSMQSRNNISDGGDEKSCHIRRRNIY